MRFALVVRPDRAPAIAAARAAAGRMRAAGHDVVEVNLDATDLAAAVTGVRVACVFGGDGTMLRAARAFTPLGIGLLGVNLGHLGFLTTTSLEDFDGVVADVIAGRYTTEERTLLEARHIRGDTELLRVLALNDVVVARAEFVRSIHVAARIDQDPFTVYWADGLIVATATGSTAYGFSVGGPLILPSSRAIMIVPIAPHLSFPNAVVLDVDQTISLEVQDEPARLSLDGQEEHPVRAGDHIEVRRAELVARFVRTAGMRPFLTVLRQKILKEGGEPS
ncbi:MAG: hypothetical protein NVSMB8_12800 [Candidatus Limnocylindrales bacterium]